MTDEVKKPSGRKKLLNHVFQVTSKNEGFLYEEARATYDEVIELVNDAIDHAISSVERGKEYHVERSMSFFVHHVLMPFSYAIYMDLLAANLPACFMELRFMVESMSQCCLADLRYPDQTFFKTRLESLKNEIDEKNLSTSKLMKLLGKELGQGDDFVAIWGKLSNSWVHPWGVVDRITDRIVRRSDVPAWALIVPTSYAGSDLDDLSELHDRISEFRNLLRTTMEKY